MKTATFKNDFSKIIKIINKDLKSLSLDEAGGK